MRIVGGVWGGRRLAAPRTNDTRPTSDRVREALFSILGPLDGQRCLDLFAGTGAVGLEALSRGAAHATFVEKGSAALKALTANLASVGTPVDRYTLLRADVRRASARLRGPFAVIYADPPYDQVNDLTSILFSILQSSLSEDGVAIIEHRRRDPSPIPPAGLVGSDVRFYGETALAFYRHCA